MNYAEEEATIDVKHLLFYVLKHWKQLLLFLIIGAFLGGGYGLLRRQETPADLSSLNGDKIAACRSAQELYELQLENDSRSLLAQMNPSAVYSAYRTYYLTVPATEAELIAQRYNLLLESPTVLDELLASSGLDCTRQDIRSLLNLSFEPIDIVFPRQTDSDVQHANVTIGAFASDETTAEALLNGLDVQVLTLQKHFTAQYPGFSYEKLSENSQFGYDENLILARNAANAQLTRYADQAAKLKEQLSEGDMLYYTWNYEPEKLTYSPVKQAIKYALLVGGVLFVLAGVWYVVRFLADDHIKTDQDIADYGLYPIACLETGNGKKQDQLLSGNELPTNDRAYLLTALKTLCPGKTVLCADPKDAEAAALTEWLASEMEGLSIHDFLAKDETGLSALQESDGLILFIRLWQTTATQLKRELHIIKQTDKLLKGIVILRN